MLLDKMSHTGQRVVMSSFSLIIVLFSIYYAKHSLFVPIYLLLLAAIICAALKEYYNIARKKGFYPLDMIGFGATLLFVASVYLSVSYNCCSYLPFVAMWLAFIAIFLYYFSRGHEPLANSAVTYFGLIYLSLPLSGLAAITYYFPEGAAQDGRWWLIYLLLISKMTDTAAFFAGSAWGKHKMTPTISPKKSWEGAASGLAGAVVASILFFMFCHLFWEESPVQMTFFQSLWIAVVISLLAQIGDLAESLLKRDGGVKDSSHLPGLGGMLDIVDSLVLTTPFLYFTLRTLY